MGNSQSSHNSPKVLLAGNDGAGKTTLLYAAANGSMTTNVSTVGVNNQKVHVGSSNEKTALDVFDFGGGVRSGNMFLGGAQQCSGGLIFVINTSDNRLWSSLWELHACVCASGNANWSVCVVVAVTSKEDEHLQRIAQMADRRRLPPGTPATHTAIDDASWLPEWELDRQEVLRAGLTQSHGMDIQREYCLRSGGQPLQKTDFASSTPLASWHTGPWTVLPLVHGRAEDAQKPFQWLAQHLPRA